MTTWNPTEYLQFSDHRIRPAADLMARISHPGPKTVWDLGCGAGGPTGLLAARWPKARVRGVDSSSDMLATASANDHIEWILGDVESWEPDEAADVIFSNAALHWIEGHETLLPRLLGSLAPGGVLAIQMPRNHQEASHQRLYETARSKRWSSRVGHLVRESPVQPPDEYHALLRPITESLDVWETIYQQALTGDDAVATWTRATAARPFLMALGEDGEEFFADYQRRVGPAYPVDDDGVTLFAFRRLFIIATV